MNLYLLRIAVMALALSGCGQLATPSATNPTTGARPNTPAMTQLSSEQITQDTASTETIAATIPVPTPTRAVYTYQGHTLPAPPAIERAAPPVWLLVGEAVVLGSPSSYELQSPLGEANPVVVYADGVPPQFMPNLATVVVPRDAQATVVIGLPSITAFQALLHPWTSEPMLLGDLTDPTQGRLVQATQQRDANVTAFVLETLGEVRDQLLVVSITFPTGKAMYFWRLNPAATTAQTTLEPTGELAATPGASVPDQSPLANTSWKLESFGAPGQRQPLVANSAITITFQGADHVARGSAGCNSYGGRYAVGDTTLTFTDLAFTAMACDSPGVMDQERRFQQALLAVERYRLEGDRLELIYNGGNVLYWVAMQELVDRAATHPRQDTYEWRTCRCDAM